MTRHIVIIGAARSGTKILRDVMAQASGAGRVPYDIGFVWRYGNEHVPHDVLNPATVTPRISRFVRRYVDRYAHGGHEVVIEKTVGNTLRVPFVHAVLPEATFVHLVRDGRDAAESARRQWSAPVERRYLLKKARHFPLRLLPSYGRKYATAQLSLLRGTQPHAATWGPRYPGIDDDVAACDLLTVCARQWRTSVEYATRDLARVSAPVINVRYEQLVGEPLTTLTDLLDQLGLAASAEDRQRAAARLDGGRAGAGARSLDSSELALISAELDPTLDAFGYVG